MRTSSELFLILLVITFTYYSRLGINGGRLSILLASSQAGKIIKLRTSNDENDRAGLRRVMHNVINPHRLMLSPFEADVSLSMLRIREQPAAGMSCVPGIIRLDLSSLTARALPKKKRDKNL